MSLSYLQETQLHRIEVDLRRSEPHLGAMLSLFGKLYSDQDVPAWEQVSPESPCRDRLHRAAARFVAALSATAAAISPLLAAVSVAAAGWRTQAPAERERTRPGRGAAPGRDVDTVERRDGPASRQGRSAGGSRRIRPDGRDG
jgi:hypothetical protein